MMKQKAMILLSILIAFAPIAHAQEKSPIVRLDSALDAIVPPDAKVEKLAGNFRSNEGPVWVRKGGFLIFSDSPANVIHKWSPADGKVTTFLDHPSTGGTQQADRQGTTAPLSGSNGITLDRQGRVVYLATGDKQIVRLEKDGKRTVLASDFQGKPFEALNDLVYKSNGTLYITDPGRENSRVYLLKDGKLQLATKDLPHPNGLAFAPGEKHLYINDTFKMTILRYDVQPDDTITNGQLVIDMNADHEHAYPDHGFPDGMKVDQKGNLYCTGPGGLWIISPDGKHLGTILFAESNVEPRPAIGVSNVAFGDADGKALYLTVRTALYRIRLQIPGIRP